MPADPQPRTSGRDHVASAPPYHPGLDGLRAVALILVLLYHGDLTGVRGGFLGVSVFFTLSGYLIASLLLDERRRTGAIDLRRFWSRRARRLLPALGASIVLSVLYTARAGEPDQLASLRGDVIASLGYVTNWHLIGRGQSYADWFVAPSPVLHLWSLAIEEQFYLLFPPLAALGLRRWDLRRLAWLVFGGVLASTAAVSLLHEPGLDTTRAYFGTDTRAAEILVGVLLAMMVGLRPGAIAATHRRVVGAAGLAGALVLARLATTADVATPWLYRGGFLLTALATSLVILAVVHDTGPVARVLAWRPLRLVGLISYGAYLYHWPIFLWLDGTRTGLDPVPLLVLRCAVTTVVALLSFVLLERPVRLGRLVPTRLAPGVLAVAALALVLGTVSTTVGARPSLLVEAASGPEGPPPLPPDPTVPASSPDHDGVAPPGAAGAPDPSTTTAPGRGDGATPATTAGHDPAATPTTGAGGATSDGAPPPASTIASGPSAPGHTPPRVLVVGDSVATTLGKGLEAWAKDHGDAIVWPTWRFGCGILRGGQILFSSGLGDVDPACDRWPSDWTLHLDRFDPDVVVVLSGVWDVADRSHPRWDGIAHLGEPAFDAYLREEYVAAVDLLSSRGATVVWLTAPCVGDRSLPGPLTDTRAFDLERLRDLNERIVPQLLAARPGAVRGIDLYGELCPDDRYVRSYGDVEVARPDGLHFERDGARAVADWLMPQLLGTIDPAAAVAPRPSARRAP